jgi:hypothetical protein
VIMDGDGEDAPNDVPRLIERLHGGDGPQVVFAERRRRSESWFFRVSYLLYRWTHRWLTGIPVRVGNFSALPGALVERLVVVSELWNHYAAAVFKARLPRTSIPTTRAARLGGAPKMNFVSLVAHGLSALSVHAEIIGVRLFVVTLAAVGVVILLLMMTISGYMLGRVTVPAWAGVGIGVLLLLLMQAIGLAMGFVFLVLHARSQPLFIPLRDYTYFLSRIDVLRPSPHA